MRRLLSLVAALLMVFSIGVPVSAASARNLADSTPAAVDPVSNGGFESGSVVPQVFDHGDGGAWSVRNWTARSGSWHARYKSVGQTTTAAIQTNGPSKHAGVHPAVDQGDVAVFSAWVKSDAGDFNRFRPRAFFFDANGQLVSAPVGATVRPTTSYQQVSMSAVAPAGAAYVVFQVQLFAEGYDGNYWVDDLSATIGSGSPTPTDHDSDPGPVPAGIGVLSNGGFESGGVLPQVFDHGDGGAWSVRNWTARSGSWHARYKSVGQTTTAAIQTNGPSRSAGVHPAVSPGDTVTFSAWVKSDAGDFNRFRPRAFLFDANGQLVSAPVGATVRPTTSYQQVSMSAVAPAGAAYVVFQVQLFAEGYDGNYWVDDLSATIGSASALEVQLAPGATGPAVEHLQRLLTAAKLYRGPIDGHYPADPWPEPGTMMSAVYAFHKFYEAPAGVAWTPGDHVDAVWTVEDWDRLHTFTPAPPVSRSGEPDRFEVDAHQELMWLILDGEVAAIFHISVGGEFTYYWSGTKKYEVAHTPRGDLDVDHYWAGYRQPGWMYRAWYYKYTHRWMAMHGYERVPPYPASHGCVRVTWDDADWIYARVGQAVGTPFHIWDS